MSNIPRARRYIERALDYVQHGESPLAKKYLALALENMTRKPPVRRARSKPVKIDAALKAHIKRLAKIWPDKTIHEIASMAGVRNSGRVSEVLNGLR